MRTTALISFSLLLNILTAISSAAAEPDPVFAEPPMPAFRVETDGFEASEPDVRAICSSAGRELWRLFPDYGLTPFVVTRGRQGPIVLFQRNDRGEIVMRLDTQNTYWCQYAYQFTHEFCHILCGYDEDFAGNKWFEETLCETASLFCMRAMSRSWENDPPYPHWKDYRHALRSYTDDVIAQRKLILEIYEKGLKGFYQDHKNELEKDANLRDLNGAMSLVLLRLFEEDPQRWEAVRWLNHEPSPEGETFSEYLQKWLNAVPDRHKPFVSQVARLYGFELPQDPS